MTREHVRPRFLDDVPSGVIQVCAECNVRAGRAQAEDYDGFKRSANKEQYKPFLSAVYEIEALLLVRMPDERLAKSFTRILFASVITSVETYLADTFLSFVQNSPALLRRCVEQIPELKERKLDLGAIFGRYEGLGNEVRDYLLGVIFHDLAKVNRMYQSVLDVHFPKEMGDLYRAVKLRHDIVHRSGKSKQGASQVISASDLRTLVAQVKKFIGHIEEQLAANASREATVDE